MRQAGSKKIQGQTQRQTQTNTKTYTYKDKVKHKEKHKDQYKTYDVICFWKGDDNRSQIMKNKQNMQIMQNTQNMLNISPLFFSSKDQKSQISESEPSVNSRTCLVSRPSGLIVFAVRPSLPMIRWKLLTGGTYRLNHTNSLWTHFFLQLRSLTPGAFYNIMKCDLSQFLKLLTESLKRRSPFSLGALGSQMPAENLNIL